MAKRYDMVFEVGTDFRRDFWLEAGPDADVHLHTAHMQVRGTIDGPVVLDLTTANGRLQTDYGRVGIRVQDTAVIDLASLHIDTVSEPVPSPDAPTTGRGPVALYDLFLYAPDGTVTRLLEGRIVFVPSVTVRPV